MLGKLRPGVACLQAAARRKSSKQEGLIADARKTAATWVETKTTTKNRAQKKNFKKKKPHRTTSEQDKVKKPEFRRGYVPLLMQPPPPERIRWPNIGAGAPEMLLARRFACYALTLLFGAWSWVLIWLLVQHLGTFCLACYVLGTNAAAAPFLRQLTEAEWHADEVRSYSDLCTAHSSCSE